MRAGRSMSWHRLTGLIGFGGRPGAQRVQVRLGNDNLWLLHPGAKRYHSHDSSRTLARVGSGVIILFLITRLT